MINEYLAGSPLVLISILSIISLVTDALIRNRTFSYLYSIATLIIIIVAAAYTFSIPYPNLSSYAPAELISGRMVTFGGYAALFDILFCIGGILTILAAKPYISREYEEHNEFYTLILFATGGMMLIAHTNNLLIMFIGIEIMSVTFYILAGYFRKDTFSVEASLKYFLLGAFSTGFLLYGIAMIYGSTGTFDLIYISSMILNGTYQAPYMLFGLALLVIGLSFKTAIVPFHQWAPDVYQGSPTIVTGFMSTAGKSAALIGFIIIGRSLLPWDTAQTAAIVSTVAAPNTTAGTETIRLIIAVLASATMLIGNISALVQKNVKRMLAYSSVAHAGYLLIGLVAGNRDGWIGIVYYSYAYMFMQIGAFVIVSVLEKHSKEYIDIQDYAGLGKTKPFLAAAMAIFMFSLVGLPPFAGFFGKYYLFASAIKAGYTWLTIVAVISTIISIYFYIGLIVQMYFRDSAEETTSVSSRISMAVIAASIAGVLFLGVYPSLLADAAGWAF